jgi:hypothetical protein
MILKGYFDNILKNKTLISLLRFRFEMVIFGFFAVYLTNININHIYDGNNPIYRGNLINILKEYKIESIVTPGRVHGIDELNVQFATNLPVWVPFNDANNLYCGISNLGNYKEYVSNIRNCFSNRGENEWKNICKNTGTFGILDFKKNNLNIHGDIIYDQNGIVVFNVCNNTFRR